MKEVDTKKISRDTIIEKIDIALQEQGTDIRDNGELTPEEKLFQMDVILDVLHFLADYEENVEVLNKYWVNKRLEEKMKSSLRGDER